MKSKTKGIIVLFALLFIAGAVFAIYQAAVVNKAHQTFENYYAFRGCKQLISRSDDNGYCRTTSGQIIKIVKFRNKWYLDGDLPLCWKNICL